MDNTTQTVSIVADDRERCTPVLDALRRHPGAQLRVERLPVGDYRVDEALLIRAQDPAGSGRID
jgi:ERCC4-type nuclease